MFWTRQRKVSAALLGTALVGIGVSEGLLLGGASVAEAGVGDVLQEALGLGALDEAETLLTTLGEEPSDGTGLAALLAEAGYGSGASLFGEPMTMENGEPVRREGPRGPQVTGIMRGGGVEAAVVNGGLMRVGERRDGMELLSIGEDRVRLRLVDGTIVTVETPRASERGIRGVEPGGR
ncbi:MAG: hypothetical protein AAGG07_01465 [Planctomycetota bacterium]